MDNWLSILEASYLISLSRPYHRNFNKRIVKAPKLHFLDVGLASWLLGIREASHVEIHPLRGQLFESMIYSDMLKDGFNSGQSNELFYFRDSNGNEVDIIRGAGENLEATEIKSSRTYRSDHLETLKWFAGISGQDVALRLVYGGHESFSVGNCRVESWLGNEESRHSNDAAEQKG